MFNKVLCVLGLSICANFSTAGDGSGLVDLLLVNSSADKHGVVMFRTEQNNNKATCSNVDNGRQWAFSLEHEQGKAMYALLLSATAQKVPVVVFGSNSCNAWGDREDPVYIYIEQS